MSVNPKPSLFDEALARRLDTLLTAVGALLLLGVELAALAQGDRLRALFLVEAFSLSLLAFAGLLRFARAPWLAVLSTTLVLILCLRISWFQRDLPAPLFPLALGLLTNLFLWRSRLPRPVIMALIATSSSLAVLMTLERGTFSAAVLCALIAASARSQPISEPSGSAHWRGDQRWWFVLVAAMAMMLLSSTFHLLREPLELASRSLLHTAILLGAVTSMVWLMAWSMLLRGVVGPGSSTFWGALRLGVRIQLVLVVLLMGAQLYGLAGDRVHLLAYVAAGHSLTYLILGRMVPLALLIILRGAGRARADRLPWPWLVVGMDGLTLSYRTALVALELDRTDAAVVAVGGLLMVLELVATWGLMRSLRDELRDTSVADTFSSDPETPEPRRV